MRRCCFMEAHDLTFTTLTLFDAYLSPVSNVRRQAHKKESFENLQSSLMPQTGIEPVRSLTLAGF